MAGGLMQLVATGQQNVILNGNPQKTFWKATYKKGRKLNNEITFHL
jgi:hypothetical protein